MVREWNGSLVHYSEFEAKQPQLDPKPVGSDPQGLFNPRPQPASKVSLILLGNNPFTSIKYGGATYVNVYSQDHQRSAGDVVNRFYPCMMSGLAYYLSQKYSPDRSQELERRYESELLRALDADNQGTSTFISPQTFYGDGV